MKTPGDIDIRPLVDFAEPIVQSSLRDGHQFILRMKDQWQDGSVRLSGLENAS
jgi:hypothetical protein